MLKITISTVWHIFDEVISDVPVTMSRRSETAPNVQNPNFELGSINIKEGRSHVLVETMIHQWNICEVSPAVKSLHFVRLCCPSGM